MPEISDKYVPFVRAQLRKLIRAAAGEPISVERMAQDFVGAIMQKTAHCEILSQEASFDGFKAAMLSPAMPERDGAVMYVHGGGYCCGDIGYAKGFLKVSASPLTRSSHHAGEDFEALRAARKAKLSR